MRRLPGMIFILFASAAVTAQAFVVGQSCGQLFDQTDNVIAYIADLTQNQQLNSEQTQRLYRALEENDEFVNPFTKQDAIQYGSYIHWEKFEDLIKDKSVDKRKLKDWLKRKIKDNQRVKAERGVVKSETESSSVKMTFNRVEAPGEFTMSADSKSAVVKLTHPFEMMSSHVTQEMWLKRMSNNPSYFKKGKDHPVESITWWSAIEFANRVSREFGLEPVYDTSQIHFVKGTSAEEGTLKPDTNYEALKLRINAPDGDIYKAEGFRLPTRAELVYAIKHLTLPDGQPLDMKKLDDYVVYHKNSDDETRPVDEKRPLLLDGKEYHDLIGNVWNWAHDYDHDLYDGENPRGPDQPTREHYRVISGGSWHTSMLTLHHYADPNRPKPHIGVRLVRTLK